MLENISMLFSLSLSWGFELVAIDVVVVFVLVAVVFVGDIVIVSGVEIVVDVVCGSVVFIVVVVVVVVVAVVVVVVVDFGVRISVIFFFSLVRNGTPRKLRIIDNEP